MLIGPKDLTTEEYREYELEGGKVYKIFLPQALYFTTGGQTHRVVDAEGVVHCIPFGPQVGTILRWKNKDTSVPVNF